ncbi:DNA gyrase subunit B [Kitasatospora sp. NPDC092948]|uniref:DNA gyrase subunit B n=1 Tax=Kitasatospora sp. NPDC092948 TaxID=3364088 RepID=UPI003812D928
MTYEYNGTTIKVLEGLEAVRKRPGMYIGSTGERGLHTMLYEVAQPAIGEVLLGRARRVEVVLLADGSVRVAHDSCYEHPLEQQLTVLTMPRSARGGCMVGEIGFGIGLYVVNALSDRLVAEERKDGLTARQEYARGEPAVTARPEPANDTGTVITFRPDPEIFETVAFDRATLAERFRELAALNRTLDLTLTDARGDAPHTERFHVSHGVREFLAHLGADPARAVVIEREDERMGGSMEIALAPTADGTPQLAGFANSRRTKGGTHLRGFRDGVRAALGRSARLTAVVSVKLDEPELEGCTREFLGNTPVRNCVAEAVQQALEAWRDEHPERAAALTAAR